MQLELGLSVPEIDARDTARVFEDSKEMQLRAPSLFAMSAHPKMSDRYAFTNTYDILLHMHNRGFKVTSVMGGRKKWGKVLIRMRHPAYDKRDYAPELCVIDSHDGSSMLTLLLGFIAFLCENGMIVGDMLYRQSFKHVAPDLMQQVLLELDDIQEPINKLSTRVDAMKNHPTTVADRILLADAAIYQRFGQDKSEGFVVDMRRRMLNRRRYEDEADDIYTVMNVIQENVLRGGMMYNTGSSVRRLNPISEVSRNMQINQSLWITAEAIMNRSIAA